MKLKTSFFNRTLFLKNITRFWPVWALYLVVLFFSMPLNLYMSIHPAHERITDAEKTDRLFNCIEMNLSPVLIALFAILCALAVFSYLYSSRNCNMIHAFPVKRGELFCTGYVSGLLFLIVPQIVMFLLTLLVSVLNGVPSVEYLFYWLLFEMGMSFLFYSFAVFFCMLTGNHFAAVVYYGLGNVIYLIVKALIISIEETVNFGLADLWSAATKDVALSPLVFLIGRVDFSWNVNEDQSISDIVMSGGHAVALYLIAAVVLTAFSVLLYRRRQLECAGDILSLNWLKPVFRWLAAFGAGTGFALLFSLVFFPGSSIQGSVLKVCSVGFSVIFFFVAEMLIQKKFRVFAKKRILEWAVCAAAIFVMLTAIDADWFGVERYIPEEEQIQAVSLREDYDLDITDPEGIGQMREIHRMILENKGAYQFPDWTNEQISYIYLDYSLKNGRKISRNYGIPVREEDMKDPDTIVGKIILLQNNPEAYIRSLFGADCEDARVLRGSYSLADEFGGNRELTKEEAAALFEAVKQDIEEGNYFYGLRSYLADMDNTYYNSLTFEVQVRQSEERKEDPGEYATTDSGVSVGEEVIAENGEKFVTVYPFFQIFTTSEHTIQTLLDLGVITNRSDLVLESDYENGPVG